MEIPIAIAISAIPTNEFAIYHFRDKRHGISSPPHFHVIVPISDQTCLCLCIITSKYENLYDHYSKNNLQSAADSLVYLDQNSFSFLDAKKGCVINCNQAELILREEFETKVLDCTHGILFKASDGDFSDDLKKTIVKAIKQSPLVKPIIKNALPTIL